MFWARTNVHAFLASQPLSIFWFSKQQEIFWFGFLWTKLLTMMLEVTQASFWRDIAQYCKAGSFLSTWFMTRRRSTLVSTAIRYSHQRHHVSPTPVSFPFLSHVIAASLPSLKDALISPLCNLEPGQSYRCCITYARKFTVKADLAWPASSKAGFQIPAKLLSWPSLADHRTAAGGISWW